MKVPGPDHPIGISRFGRRVTVTADGDEIASSARALVLEEANYPPVHYIPREDADMDSLKPADHSTYCPYKGNASYFSIPALGERGRNAVWSYEAPYAAVADIAGYLAFYRDRVTIGTGD